jgi:hypothetical protein
MTKGDKKSATMNIVLVYLDIDVPQDRKFSFGSGSVASYLRSIGHEVHVCIASRHSDIEKIIEKIEHFSPALCLKMGITEFSLF